MIIVTKSLVFTDAWEAAWTRLDGALIKAIFFGDHAEDEAFAYAKWREGN